MRNVFIVVCGLFTVVATWALYRDSELGPRVSNPSTRDLEGERHTMKALATTRAGLEAIIQASRTRVAANAGDGEAAVRLADALMRMARVNADASLAIQAERVLRLTLQHSSFDYMAQRMLSVVYLSQHRFEEALSEARKAQKLRPTDAWNYAVAGDALLELGRYDEAFDSFEQVMERRPDAGAYARVAYARELQGDLDGAVQLMQMAAEATSPHDAEALAWTYAQLATLYVLQDRFDDAEREFDRADYIFPSHPYVMNGRVRLLVARHRYADALDLSRRVPTTPESLAIQGDLLARMGHAEDAEKLYRDAEQMEREGWKQEHPQPGALARFLAERGRNIPDAIALAERAANERQDVNTMDALAWSYFRGGRVADAALAIQRATRLGTVDPRIRCHASAIARSQREGRAANSATCDPLDPQG